MTRPIGEIVVRSVPDPKIQAQWDRQYRTAEAIGERFESGLDTVLLADEVGMGKTYVAMAVIAHHVFQTSENDRKVLLVVPPNNILARKWEQDLRSFNQNYVKSEAAGVGRSGHRKYLRHMHLTTDWQLLQNLQDFKDQDPTINGNLLDCIRFALKEWQRTQSKRRKKLNYKTAYDEFSPEYLEFQSTYSLRAFFEYLDNHDAVNPRGIDNLFQLLRGKGVGNLDKELRSLFRGFARKQDSYEANVYAIGMSALRHRRIDRKESQLFNTYVISLAMRGKHADTRERVVSKLEKTPIIIPRFAYERKVKYGEWIKNIGNIDLWGLRADAEAVLAAWPEGFDLERLLDSGAKPGPVFKKFQDQVMARKLASSGITLCVIDEIHNWKNGGNGAEDFAHRFAPSIERKLILSATPFQIEEGELRKVFVYASGTASSPSLAIVDQILADSGPAKACLEASSAFRAAWEGLRKEDLLALNSVLIGVAQTEPAGLESAFPKAERTETLDKLLVTITHYHAAILSLQAVLKRLIIRHTKNRDKRHFHSGHEFAVSGRPDYGKARQSLYETAGFGKPDNALISFLGMRVDQLIRRDADKAGTKPKAHLLGGITSSISAFRESNKQLTSDKSGLSEYTRGHLRFFERALGSGKHPKVEATVQRALENYLRGHKTLIFCERLATLAEIKSELDEGLKMTLFNSIPQDRAKSIRKVWLARHKDVEFYWHASYILLNGPETAREMSASVKRSWNAILARMHEISAGLGSRLNERQTDKLLDLASLEFLTQEFPNASPGGAAVERLTRMFRIEGDENRDALRQYLRLHKDKDVEEIEAGEGDDDPLFEAMAESTFARLATDNIWVNGKDSKFHQGIWQLLDSEIRQLDDGGMEGTQGIFSRLLLDLPQGLRKVLIRTDWIPRFHDKATPSDFSAVASALCNLPAALIQDDYSDRQSPWDRTADFLLSLNESEGSLNRQSRRNSKRQGLWKGVFLGEEAVHNEIQGGVYAEKRVNLCAAFNSPLAPDILICTSIGSEGIDLHRHCADVIHHDLPWNPAKLEQRTGRVDRVGSRVEIHGDPARLRLNIGIPFLAHDYEQFQYELLLSRAQKFEILLGKPEFSADVDNEDQTDEDGEVTKVLETSPESHLGSETGCLHLPEAIVRCLRMDLAVVPD